jgi:hypothetical protein
MDNLKGVTLIMSTPAYEPTPATARPTYPAAPVATRAGWDWRSMVVRGVLTLIGAAGMIVGAFMDWTGGRSGVNLGIRSLWTTEFSTSGASFVATVGFAFIVLGLLAIVGLAPATGWLTRLAGALGIAGFVLFAIEIYRANLTASDIQAGAWVALAGSVVALVGGFLGGHRAVVAAAPTQTVVE